jgi:hypothetical protein
MEVTIVDATTASPVTGPQPAPAPSAVQREILVTMCLVVGAVLLGMVLQTWIPPGGTTLVAAAFLAGVVVVALAHLVPGRLRQTIAGFRFVATLLFVLAGLSVLGTLIVQLKPPRFYAARYGALAQAIVGFRLDDLFHGVPFALLMALFGASVIASATLRWPPRLKAAGFLVCHLGLLTSLAGSAASATLAIRGRIDLYAGGDRATQVRVTKGGQPTGETAALGFDLALDRFEAQSYEAEYRVGYYERQELQDEHGAHENWKLLASFDPDLERHRLPNGDSFRLTGIYPDFRWLDDAETQPVSVSQEWKNPAVGVEAIQQGERKEQLMAADHPSALFLSPARALAFERRSEEKRAYVSWVTARQGSAEVKRIIKVNEPMSHAGWTLYQANYDPKDPSYSGLDAVRDPGVSWVFTGFALICAGVLWMFYVEPRLRKPTGNPARNVHA